MKGHDRQRDHALQDRIESFAADLKPNYLAILRATAAGGTDAEVAAALKIPLGTLKSRLHRARAALAKMSDARAGLQPVREELV